MVARVRIWAAVLALMSLATSASAQTFIQPDTGTSANWSTAPWIPGTPTSSTSTIINLLTRGGNTNPTTFSNDLGAFTLNAMNFENYGTGTFTQTSTTLFTLDGASPSINFFGSANRTLGGTGQVSLSPASGTTTIGGSGNGSLNISRVITGSGGLTINRSGNGIISLVGANTFTGNVTLTNGVLQMGTSANALGAASNQLIINGGMVRYSSGGTFANTIVLNSADYIVAAGTGALTGNSTATVGPITGNGGVQLIGYNTLSGPTLTSANTYNGPTVIKPVIPTLTITSAPTLTLSGAAGTALNSPSFEIHNLGNLVIGGTTANADRIGDSANIALHNGRMRYVPVTAGTFENFGDLTISGYARIGGTATGVSGMTGVNFNRVGRATLNLDSVSFGTVNSATTAINITFTGTNPGADNYAVGTGAGQEIDLIPWAVAGSDTNPAGFVRYDATTGGLTHIPRTNSTFVFQQSGGTVSPAAVLNRNVNLNGAGTYTFSSPSYTINGLTSTGSVTLSGSGTINLANGVWVNFDPVTVNGPTIDFGSRTGYIFQAWTSWTLTGSSSITGSNGLVISSPRTEPLVFSNTPGNPFTGGLTLNGTTTTVGYTNDNQLGAAGEGITMSGGSIWYNSAASYTMNRPITITQHGGGIGFNRPSGAATASTRIDVAGVVSGAGTFIKEGVGIVRLSNASNTFSGGVHVINGTLEFGEDSHLGAANSRIILQGGTLEAFNSLTTSNREIQVVGNASLGAPGGVTATYAGELNNLGNLYGTAVPTLTKTGAGTVVLTAASPRMTGNVTVSGGDLQLANAGTLRGISVYTLNAPGARLVLDNTAVSINRLNPLGRLVMTAGTEFIFAGNAGGSVDNELPEFNSSGSNTLTVFAPGSPAVLTFARLSGGGSTLYRGNNLGIPGNAQIFFGNLTTNQFLSGLYDNNPLGGGFALPFYDTVVGVRQALPGDFYNNPQKVIQNSATPWAFGPPVPITPLDAFVLIDTPTWQTGAPAENNVINGLAFQNGVLTVSNNLTLQTGLVFVLAGALNDLTGGNVVAPGAVPLSFNPLPGTGLTVLSTLVGAGGLAKNLNGTLILNGNTNVTGGLNANAGILSLNGPIAAGNAVTVSAGATFNVQNGLASTFGATTINGTLNVANAGTAPTFGATTINNGGLLSVTGTGLPTVLGATTVNLGGAVNLPAGETINATAFNTLAGSAVTLNGTLNIAGASTIAGPITGNGPLNFVPAAVVQLTMNGNQAGYAGNVTSGPNGRILVNNVNGFGTGDLILQATASSSFSTPLVGFCLPTATAGTWLNNIVLPPGPGLNHFFIASTANGGGTSQQITLAGVISGGNAGSTLVIDESGTSQSNAIILTNPNNTFAMNLRVDFGTLGTTSNAALGDAANQVILQSNSPNGAFRMHAPGIVFPATRTIDVAAGVGGINTNGFTAEHNGPLTGAGTLTKRGLGTLKLNNPVLAHTGPIVVDAGVLQINGTTSATGSVTVGNGAKLEGNGTIARPALTVNTGGTLAGGVSSSPNAGTLTLTGTTVTFNAGAIFGVGITDGSTPSSLPGGSTIGTLPNPTSNSYIFRPVAQLTVDPSLVINVDGTGTTFTIDVPYSYTVGQVVGLDLSPLLITTDAQFNFVGMAAQLGTRSLTGDVNGFIYLTFTPIPEPGLLAGLAGLGLLALRRRRG